MAETAKAALALLETMRAAALPKAKDELAELTAFAAQNDAETPLQPWDVGFWRERLREERFALQEEAVRPYFPAAKSFERIVCAY